MNETTITMLKPDSELVEIIIKYSIKPPWYIESYCKDIKLTRYEGSDLFECLSKLRSQLDNIGIKLLCNGSRIDAYPSRMSRDMGGARKVYLLKLGQQGRLEDLVDIFDEAPVETIGTVSEQNRFYNKWLDSLQ